MKSALVKQPVWEKENFVRKLIMRHSLPEAKELGIFTYFNACDKIVMVTVEKEWILRSEFKSWMNCLYFTWFFILNLYSKYDKIYKFSFSLRKNSTDEFYVSGQFWIKQT